MAEELDKATDIISDINTAQDSETLMKGLEKISDYADQYTSKFIESGDYRLAMKLYEMVANSYDKAAKMIKTDQKFSDLKNFAKSFLSTANYWHKKTESAKTEITDRLRNIGSDLQFNSKHIESIKYFDKVLDIDPDDPKSWLDKGNSFYYLQRFDDAIACYDKAIKIDQNNTDALCNKGLALENLGRYEYALEYFDLALEKNPKIEYALLGKGHVCLELEKYDESEKAYKSALDLNDKSVDAMIGLSSVYQRDRFDNAKAAEYTEKALKINPDMTLAKANLAEYLLEFEKDYKKREKLVDEVLKDEPDEYGYPMRLVKVCSLYFRNETDKAIVAASDLLEYSKSIHHKQILNWDFRGLKHMIEKKKISNQVKEVLLSFVSLAETSYESVKFDILESLPEKIRPKGVLRSFFNANEVSVFKKKPKPNIIVKNTSTPDPMQPGWYNWEIHLEPQESLNKVKEVTYILHKTFLNPVRRVTDRESGFKLISRGWGEFQVKVEIRFDDDKKKTKYHWLDLGPTPLDDDVPRK